MIGSHFLAGSLILLGLLCELHGLPVPRQTLMPPPMDLLLLLLTQLLRGGTLVFWAGFLGLSEDLIQQGLPGAGTCCFVTAALVAAILQGSQAHRPSLIDRLLGGLCLLAVLWGLRAAFDARQLLAGAGTIHWNLAIQRIAVTFLAFLIIDLTLALAAPLRLRRQLA
jgi:hypothetical protein